MRQKLCYPKKYQYLQHLVDFTKYYYNISKNSIRNSGNILAFPQTRSRLRGSLTPDQS